MNIIAIENKIRRIKDGEEYLKLIKGINTERLISVDEIINTVCSVYQVTPELLKVKCRETRLVEPRRMIYFLCDFYGVSGPSQMSKLFKQDHTTAIHMRNSGKDLLSTHDDQFEGNFLKCKAIIENQN